MGKTASRSELQELIRDKSTPGTSGLWATVLFNVMEAGRQGNTEAVRRFIQSGPVDVVAFELGIEEEELKALLQKETRNGNRRKTPGN